jgi:hypothetical protein
MLRAGLEVIRVEETPGLDTDLLARGSDFLLIEARPLCPPGPDPVTLLVKTCPMEWRTIEVQICHLVGQLEGPQKFSEKVVVVDDHPGPYPRQYDSPNRSALLTVLDKLSSEGVIDRMVIPSRDPGEVAAVNHRWFGIRSTSPSSPKGEPTYAFLSALETCKTDLVLQADSDCLVGRKDRNHDYLDELVGILRRDPEAVTVCMPVPLSERRDYTPSVEGQKWRVESRFALLSRSRMERLRPLPNVIERDEKLSLPWYRSLDERLRETTAQSYRGGDPRTYFVHVPNARKRPINDWYNILRSVERGSMPPAQLGKVDLVGSSDEWVGQRKEEIVFVVRGKDVPAPKLRRCIDSLAAQVDQSWGAIFVDGGSTNGVDEYLREVVVPKFKGRSSLYANLEPLRPAENTWIAIRRFVSDPSTIIVTLDADDALTSPGATAAVKSAHLQGADLTIGSMLRTDKEVNYPITLREPRKARGGNVWVHPRTFRKGLFDRLDEGDLKINGEWVSAADDWAFMVPMVEMAKSPLVLTEALYLYDPSGTRVGAKREQAEAIIGQILSRPPKVS